MRQSIACPSSRNTTAWPDPWRMAIVAICALILCSCRSPGAGRSPMAQKGPMGSQACHVPNGPAGVATLPADAYSGGQVSQCGWTPPGIQKPWPKDEYLRDGGDGDKPVGVDRNKQVVGLKMEDTVARFDTLDGRTVVEPSNEVVVYSPRFGSVRQVVGLKADEERQRIGGVHLPEKLETPTTIQIAANAKQNIQLDSQTSARPPVALRGKQGEGAMSNVVGPRGFRDAFKAYEDLSVVRMGKYEQSEKALLLQGSNAAIAWTHNQAVQIILERTGAMAEVKYDSATSLYTAEMPPGCPRLRLIKLASTDSALPGEELDFTIRFDNVGNQPINHVAILDSLGTRLELVPGSAQCSVDATISTEPNEGESVVIRCEVQKPLPPGEGGILHFRCRVR